MDGTTVICKTISDFRDHCFKDRDKFQYALIVPKTVLSGLENTDQYEYVELSSPDLDASGTLAQILTFSEEHDSNEFSTDDGIYYACVRTALQKEIGLEPDNDENIQIRIKEHDSTTIDSLQIRRVSVWEQDSRDITTEGVAGYVTEDKIDEIEGLNKEDICELINPRTGSRIQLPVEPYEHKQPDENTIRLHGPARKLLRVDSRDEGEDDTVQLRVLTDLDRETRYRDKIYKWIGRRFVDYSYSQFRVLEGYDRDEGRNVVRMNEDAMHRLGIEENDRIIISWFKYKQDPSGGQSYKKKQCNVRCQTAWEEDDNLEPSESSDISSGERESLFIRVPSTERDDLSISVGDSIRVRRDMRYQAGKQVSLSAFGILGVIVGTNQLINMLFDRISWAYIGISILSVLLLSIVTVYLIMTPIRQKCRVPK